MEVMEQQKEEINDQGRLEKSVHFDKDGGTEFGIGPSGTKDDTVEFSPAGIKAIEDLDIRKILTDVIDQHDEENRNVENSRKQDTSLEIVSQGTEEHVHHNLKEESEEEVIELEFERAVQKLDTHRMYCPNCNSCVTKVILRRRKRVDRAPAIPTKKPEKPVDLLGCLSCFSIFIPSGECFNLFRIFGKKSKNEYTEIPQHIPAADVTSEFANDSANAVIEQGTEHKQQVREKDQNSEPSSLSRTPSLGHTTYNNGVIKVVTDVHHGAGKGVGTSPPLGCIPPKDVRIEVREESDKDKGQALSTKPEREIVVTKRREDDAIISVGQGPVESGPSQSTQNITNAAKPTITSETNGSKTLEILKSIVYGGLVESITSLSVVSSAAAADATTLNIVVLGLANLIGGLSLIGHNLWELKDDHSGTVTTETTKKTDRYQQQLGRRENFLLHATVAVLSFLIFGLIPPITYGFSFRKSDDKDFKLVAVAAASLLCVAILAIGKAHIQKPPKFYMYIKTMMYYISTAVVASGISYVVGDLIKKLMENLGLFESSGAVTLSFPEMGSVNPAWGSY